VVERVAMPHKVCQFLDAACGRCVGGVGPDASKDFHGFLLWTEAQKVVELAQVGQLSLHLLVLPLHGLRGLFVGAQLVDTLGVLLGAACADGTAPVTLGLALPAGNTCSQGHGALGLLGQQRPALGMLWRSLFIQGRRLQRAEVGHGEECSGRGDVHTPRELETRQQTEAESAWMHTQERRESGPR
jgi:hypothetical protein